MRASEAVARTSEAARRASETAVGPQMQVSNTLRSGPKMIGISGSPFMVVLRIYPLRVNPFNSITLG